ncbi:MAG TPA: sterol desaturase family protein [Bacteroidia bacterium]|jgi:sterol desaturase/sphingolipid hydroxylase (fatty acid hydroxylase superfamily)|nr:sterol desaturase family protein [Bacteroidia bacterium]
MDLFREKLVFLISTPLYTFFILGEMILSRIHHKKRYTLGGTLMNIWLSALNFGLDFLLRGFVLVFLSYFLERKFFVIANPFLYWTALLFAEDFLFYWLHRVDHYCRFFWAVHVTHHSSEEFNLTVGFRSSVFQPLYRFIWFIPLPLLGFKGEDIMLMYAITQIYGILIHTQFIKKLGPLEWFMSTPSHHRVHHGANVKYLDKNMGMVFIFWDKLFGTFAPEEEEVKYGLTKNLEHPYNPITSVFHEWGEIIRDLGKRSSLKAKFMYVFGPPGWSHDGSKKTSRQLRKELKSKSRS